MKSKILVSHTEHRGTELKRLKGQRSMAGKEATLHGMSPFPKTLTTH